MSHRPHTFWTRWKHARLVRVLLVYLGSSLAVLELVDVFVDQLGLPEWVFPGALVLLAIGLPVIIATALVQTSIPSRGPNPASAPGGRADVARAADAPDGASAEDADERASIDAGDALALARRWLTWRRAILGGLVALALWGLIVTGYMAMRALGIGPVGSLVAAGVLEQRDHIVLAEFENHTADSALAAVVTEAFRVDLAQSRLVTVVQPDQVTAVLRRMGRDPRVPLAPDLAREIAIREGYKAVIAGEIASAGSSLVLSARLVSADTGELLAAVRKTARDSSRIVEAIDELSSDLRVRIGESLKRVRANPPLDRVTTSSLEALRKYSQGVRALEEGDGTRGIGLLEEAVDLDSTFAMAWRKLGVALINRGENRTRQVHAFTRAFELRDRLTERERYLTEGTYYQNVTREYDRVIAAYRTLLASYPDDLWALNNLALVYMQIGDYERAAETAAQLVARDSATTGGYSNLIVARINLGRLDEAEEALAALTRHHPELPSSYLHAAQLAALRGDYVAAEERVRSLSARYGPDPFVRVRTAELLATLARIQGHLAEAENHLREAMFMTSERRIAGEYHALAYTLALQRLFLGTSPEPAREVVAEAAARYPLESVPPLDRPYDLLIAFHAFDERPDEAAELLAERGSLPRPEDGADFLRGVVALAQGRYEEAIERLREQAHEPGGCAVCPLPMLAMAYERAGQPDSTLAALERYVATPWDGRMQWDSYFLGSAYERLSSLYAERDDAEKARSYYAKLAELWASADPELRARVQAARSALAPLASDR